MTRHHIRRAPLLALGLLSLAGTLGAQEIDLAQLQAERLLTTADNANPNGVLPTAPAVSSGNPTGYNDPALGFNNPRYWAKDPKYSGVTQLIMTYQTKNLATGAIGSAAFICSGSLINGGYSVLTAGHCVVNSMAGGVQSTLQSVQVRLGQQFGGNTTAEPGAGAPSVNQAFSFVQNVGFDAVHIHPDYTGSVIDQRDIAVINLGTPAPHVYQSYALYSASALGQTFNIAGWGGRGNGDLGTFASGTAGARLRQGRNTFDASYADARWSDAFKTLLFGSRGGQDVYLSDFDNGLAANDALCQLSQATLGGAPIWSDAATRPCGTGLGLDEVNSAGGDSGGPSFVNGRVAAVTSFGQSWGTGFFGDVRAGLQSSFGELAGMTRVDINADWVQSVTSTPEPATLALLGGGLLALGVATRRRRQR